MPSRGISHHDFRDHGKQMKSRIPCSGTVACTVSSLPWGREHSRLALEISQGSEQVAHRTERREEGRVGDSGGGSSVGLAGMDP